MSFSLPLTTAVLDKGHLSLRNTMPSPHDSLTIDEDVAQKARASTQGQLDINDPRMGLKGEREDRRLIEYLLRHHHASPFQHQYFQFHVKAPLFVTRQWYRHWSWKYSDDDEMAELEHDEVFWDLNEQSGRYQAYTEEYYVPTTWRLQNMSNKQASGLRADPTVEHWLTQRTEQHFAACVRLYKDYLELGVAREQARIVLPGFAQYVEFYATTNLRNLALSFLPQRDHEGAQWEMQQYAQAMLALLRQVAPITCDFLFGKEPDAP